MRSSHKLLLCAIWFVFHSAGFSAEPEAEKVKFAIAIHGGAGRAPDDERLRARQTEVLRRALDHGVGMLKKGKSSLDTVEAVIRILEDSEYFNAGKGAVFNAAGRHELDASIMDGRTRAGGAVGGVRTVRNPISLARLVMTETRHVLLVSDGAEKFADEFKNHPQIKRVPNQYFTTPARRLRWQAIQDFQRQRKPNSDHKQRQDSKSNQPRNKESRDKDSHMGTVGCVVLDLHGNLAAGTSTGGLTNKRFGRIGDSPILSAGTFADNKTCAVSCTGVGEDYIRNAVAYDVSARMEYRGDSLDKAVRSIITGSRHKVRGGIIAVNRDGQISMHFNTGGMARAAANSSGRNEVLLGK